ncbi:MAG: stage 0 sporulation protein [Coprobacillus sp.]|nr:stage 0 sporulation protein [Coprobacillus sp.]
MEEEEYIEDEISQSEEDEGEKDISFYRADYDHYIGVKYENGLRVYYFGVKDLNLEKGMFVVVQTQKGYEVAKTETDMIPISSYERKIPLKPVARIASQSDIKTYKQNLKDAQTALKICENDIKDLGLDMRLIDSEYTLDRSKLSFSYVSDERVDFRELLKVLASRFHTRIELRQVGPRDKARNIGGLGICGLPLCCSTFLNEFDGISINRAKNQMLTINIPKLSGQCNKLICCLKYEDDTYSELKKAFPDIGKTIYRDDEEYTVSAINVISNMVELRNEENVINIPLSEFDQLVANKRKRERNEKS